MNIFKKLMLSFSTVALICAIVGLIGWFGISRTEASLIAIGSNQLPAIQGLGLVMESMNGIFSSERTGINPALSVKKRALELDIQEDWLSDFKDGWDLFAATEKDKEEEQVANKAQEAMTQWEQERDKLTALLSTINLGDIETLNETLLGREIDHLGWVRELQDSVAAGQTFTGQLDPRLCGLGKWLATYSSNSSEFTAALEKFSEPHERLHSYGEKINSLMARGAKSRAEEILHQEVLPTLKEIQQVFAETKSIVRRQLDTLNAAQDISFGSEQRAFNLLMGHLDNLYEMVIMQASKQQTEAISTAKMSKLLAALAVLLGASCALLFGSFIARGISRPIHQSIKALERISRGDTSAISTVSAGKSVNCSSIKNCGNNDCPSFGKEDHCWVASGSMSIIKHCPRAKKGEDCRSCELFGAHTEVEELGSIVVAIGNNLAERERLAMSIADGNLTNEVEIASEYDAMGKALETMQQSLLSLISQTKMASNEIASGSLQIADSNQILAQGATEQASSLEEISSAMTEMDSQTKITADNARQAEELSSTASAAAEAGNERMQQMIKAMEEIRSASQSVANVIKVIDEIAFQTNMLALNAAVEAAHAGQHGKGFAVVAEEVRNLAARSAKAAKETEELIAGSVNKTKNGVQIADQTATALEGIMSGITQTTELVTAIAKAAQEQSQGIEQVSQELAQIDQVTQQNSAAAEEGAAASEELSGQAAQLRHLLQKFKVELGDQGMEETSFPSPPAQAQIVHNPSKAMPLDEAKFDRF